MQQGGGSLFGGTIPFGRVFGVEVRVHFLLLALIGYVLITSSQPGIVAIWMLALVLSVLLHELGHCLAAHVVGGRSKEIILWPLGGLTVSQYPRRPGTQFLVSAAGPAANLLLFLLCLGLLLGLQEQSPSFSVPTATGLTVFLNAMFWINLGLFVFNVIPAYPMDGGKIFLSILWAIPGVGWRRATLIATVVAMACGAGFVGLGGLTKDLWLAIIGALVIMASYQEFRRAKEFQPQPDLDDDRMPHER